VDLELESKTCDDWKTQNKLILVFEPFSFNLLFASLFGQSQSLFFFVLPEFKGIRHNLFIEEKRKYIFMFYVFECIVQHCANQLSILHVAILKPFLFILTNLYSFNWPNVVCLTGKMLGIWDKYL
jgi:hypothetical protein